MTDDWFSRFNQKIDRLQSNSPEEIAQGSNTWEAMDGTSREMAFMLEDGSVSVRTWSYKDGAMADGWEELKPSDDSYKDVCTRHGLNEPGDANTIVCKWIDGKWIEENQEKSDKAKSA
jgi:hypothetical protein